MIKENDICINKNPKGIEKLISEILLDKELYNFGAHLSDKNLSLSSKSVWYVTILDFEAIESGFFTYYISCFLDISMSFYENYVQISKML